MHNHPAVALTEQLIERPSITPNDAGCLDLLIPRLEKLGFGIERFPCQGADNLWARYGDASPVFCFAGHTDVVATGDLAQWDSDPFTPSIRDGVLYGRGAADMKSAVAAMIVAIEQFLASVKSVKGSIALLITSAEEGPSQYGTPIVIEALEKRGEKIDYCLVGEPSSEKQLGDTLKIGRRGSLHGKLAVHGKQGHIAYPHLAQNPIHQAMPVLDQLTNTVWDSGNADFSPTSLQIYDIQSGVGASNVIPADLHCQFNFRFSPMVTVEALQDRVAKILQPLNTTLDWDVSGQPFYTPAGLFSDACQQVIQDTLGITPSLSTAGGTSDGRYIAPTGTAVLELGVINASIHQVNEHVKLGDIINLTACYHNILQKQLT